MNLKKFQNFSQKHNGITQKKKLEMIIKRLKYLILIDNYKAQFNQMMGSHKMYIVLKKLKKMRVKQKM